MQPVIDRGQNNASATQRLNTDTVRSFLVQIGRVPLLSREEEIFFAQRVKQLMELLQVKEDLTEKSSSEPSLSTWANAVEMTPTQLQETLDNGEIARQKMIEANLRLVVAIAKKYQHRNLEFVDLIQEGTLGLQRGVEKFDPDKGYKFSTYAYWWIRQAITRALDQKSRSIRLPIHVCQTLKKIKKARRDLTQQLGRNPTISEISSHVSLKPAQIQDYLHMSRQPVSLDLRVGEGQDTELQDLLEDTNSSIDDYVNSQSLKECLDEMLVELTPQQREVVNLHFGLSDGRELTLTEVAKRMDISHTRVRQLQRQAIARLRRKKMKVKSFMAS
ncbi:RNA polymerase sigma factor, cyanobacterial RpoD-like family [Rivularia sp. PCC 7116]|uniref:RNA polymerase sigma factor, RpoD/SigA family n=1 Tax=Rivularia sp. PCC 7116 TaxID=373994 RepID=UPI00029F3049|nr:RNA polymerase sigma factor, RpoD/SigA family [Rivularia sp. PCC 7116]AFY56529.1 RNA polymerase sigma factor, cyanobacterial RpoD-like family [Rivularia sp. PCC 7116]